MEPPCINDELPSEILDMILTGVKHDDMAVVACIHTCKQWYVIIVRIMRGYRNRARVRKWASWRAAMIGRVELVQWLHMNEYPTNNMVDVAARNGDNEMLSWAHNNGINILDAHTICAAAEGGQITTIQLLRELGCPWDEEASMCAAVHGQLDTIKYLHGAGAPWSENAAVWAQARGYNAIVTYILGADLPADHAAIARNRLLANLRA